MNSIFKTAEKSLIEAALCGGIFQVVDKMVYQIDFDGKVFLLSAGSDFFSVSAYEMIKSWLPIQVDKSVASALTSGALYTVADMVVKFDNRGSLFTFLLQTGSSIGAGWGNNQIQKLL